jgi:hypothetical protein
MPSWHEEAKFYLNPFSLVRYSYVHAFNILLSNIPHPISVENKKDWDKILHALVK